MLTPQQSEATLREKTTASVKNLQAIRDKLNDEFVGKGHIVNMMLVCAIGQEPMVIFGEPGTAKSALISQFCRELRLPDSSYFEYLLTAFTEPDELLGVVDIDAYMKDKIFRRISGERSLPKARIAFLDEVFRANSAILNTLLSIINERVYFEGGERLPATTQVVYGASNDAPLADRNLRAFYSRFPIRLRSERVLNEFPDTLLEKGWRLEIEDLRRRQLRTKEHEAGEASTGPRPRSPRVDPGGDRSTADLDVCQEYLQAYWDYEATRWSDPGSRFTVLKKAYLKTIQLLNAAPEHFRIDDRKAIKLFKLVLAQALLRLGPGQLPTLLDVRMVLRNSWEDPELAALAVENVDRQVSAVNKQMAAELGNLSLPAEPSDVASLGL